MGMGFAPTWLCQVIPHLLHMTTLTTGDNRRPFRYFFRLSVPSTDISISWMYLFPIHSSTSSSHRLFVVFLDSTFLQRFPPILLTIHSSAALPRVICRKYCKVSFLWRYYIKGALESWQLSQPGLPILPLVPYLDPVPLVLIYLSGVLAGNRE